MTAGLGKRGCPVANITPRPALQALCLEPEGSSIGKSMYNHRKEQVGNKNVFVYPG
jgi:hypothetical protein